MAPWPPVSPLSSGREQGCASGLPAGPPVLEKETPEVSSPPGFTSFPLFRAEQLYPLD